MKKHFGRLLKCFTLSESLITLAIVGVVATMTIPVMIHSYEKQVTTVRLKKAYTYLGNVTKMSMLYNKTFDVRSSNTNNAGFNKYVRPFIEISKDCGTGAVAGCFAGENGGWYGANGVAVSNNTAGYGIDQFYKVVLKNGMSLAYRNSYTSCGFMNIFIIDIDGPTKGKSVIGKDVFVFQWAYNDHKMSNGAHYPHQPGLMPELVPYVTSNNWYDQGGYYRDDALDISRDECLNGRYENSSRDSSTCCGANRGSNCAAYIILSGWKIPDDYPFFK